MTDREEIAFAKRDPLNKDDSTLMYIDNISSIINYKQK